ncbi:MAG: hypothetical protein O7E52_19785 [Candidatus Poribacteria bacterium]|nr:hypothetical protein [Candidatus Poribacteria bacterium]
MSRNINNSVIQEKMTDGSGKIKEFALVFAAYTLLTLILTYPVILRFSTHFMGDGGDGFQNIWNMWWLKTALTERLTDPYSTSHLHYPNGVTLLFQSLSPFNGLISIPLQFMFGMKVAYNLVAVFSFIMSGVGMYFFAQYLIGHRLAAFIAGIIYTFSPYHFAHGLGHLQLVAMEWMPFFVLYLFKIFREGGTRNTLLATVFLILTTLCSWYYLIYALFFTAIFVIYGLIVQRKAFLESGVLNRLVVMLLLLFIVMSPLTGRMIFAKFTQEFTGAPNPEIDSADVTSFFVPSGMWFKSVWSKWSGNRAENSNFLGYIAFGLSIYALVRIPQSHFWGVAGAFFWLMALGPYLTVAGAQIRFPLPYLLFHNYLPFFSFAGVPGRFDVMLKFCMAILTAYAVFDLIAIYLPGTNEWLSFYPHPETERARLIQVHWRMSGLEILSVTLTGILICAEYLAIPYATTTVDVPQYYRQLADDPDEYGVIDLPTGPLTLYYATIHKKPIVGGHVSRLPQKASDFLEETPIIATLMRGGTPPPSDQIDDALAMLGEYNIRYVITHNDQHQPFLEDVLMLMNVYDQEGIKVYDFRHREVSSDDGSASDDDKASEDREVEESNVPSIDPEVAEKQAEALIQSVLRAIGSWGSRLTRRELNKVIQSQFLSFFSDTDQDKIKQLQSQFEVYDTDGDRRLTPEEVTKVILNQP